MYWLPVWELSTESWRCFVAICIHWLISLQFNTHISHSIMCSVLPKKLGHHDVWSRHTCQPCHCLNDLDRVLCIFKSHFCTCKYNVKFYQLDLRLQSKYIVNTVTIWIRHVVFITYDINKSLSISLSLSCSLSLSATFEIKEYIPTSYNIFFN